MYFYFGKHLRTNLTPFFTPMCVGIQKKCEQSDRCFSLRRIVRAFPCFQVDNLLKKSSLGRGTGGKIPFIEENVALFCLIFLFILYITEHYTHKKIQTYYYPEQCRQWAMCSKTNYCLHKENDLPYFCKETEMYTK